MEESGTVTITRREYEGLLETIHLFRSPRNAERLWLALDQAQRGEGLEMSVEELRLGADWIDFLQARYHY